MQPVSPEHDIFGNPAIRGNLDQVHPAKLLYGFFKAKKTGALKFNDGANDVWLYLSGGCLVAYERGIYAQDDFAWHLVRFGLIAEKEYQVMKRKAERKKTSLVQMLIDDGLLDADMVRKLAKVFYEKSLIGLFSWRRGAYLYYERPELEGFADRPVPLQTLRWLLDGVRRKYHQVWIEKRLEKRMDAPLKAFAEAPAPLDQLLVTADEQLVAEKIREGATPAEIIRESALTPADVRALLYALATIECIKFGVTDKEKKKKKPMPAAQAAPVDPLEKLFREAEASLTRIHLEAAREQVAEHLNAQAPADAMADLTASLTAGVDRLSAEAKQKILDKVRDMQSAAAGPEAPQDESPAIGSAEDLNELARILDAGAPLEPVPPLDAPQPSAADDAAEETFESSPAEAAPPQDLPDFGNFDLDKAAQDAGLFDNTGEKPAEETPDLFAEAASDMALNDEDPPDQVFKMGVALLDQEQWDQGYRALSRAIERGFAAGEAKVQLGWATYHAFPDDPDRFAKAAELMQQGIDQEPKNPVGFLSMGKLYMAAGDKNMAELYLVKAIELDRDCRAAKDLIRKIYQEK